MLFSASSHSSPKIPISSQEDMRVESYFYELPKKAIAQRPIIPRHSARLLVYHQKEDQVEHSTFSELAHYLPSHSLLVFNKSKVFPCRLFGQKKTGGKAEIFLLKTTRGKKGYPALIRTSSGKKKEGDLFLLEAGVKAKIEGLLEGGAFEVSFNKELTTVLQMAGKMPLPPYIRSGRADKQDMEDYQTLFAEKKGSVAAPTAGLHFTPKVLNSLSKKKIGRTALTLHVGAGTFAPVKEKILSHHQMHSEAFSFSQETWEKIQKASFKTFVGTTTLRAIESFSRLSDPEFEKFYQTDIFLYPGHKIQTGEALITNFHRPKSTLLMLVSALLGRKKTLDIYQVALEKGYRFLSYGDAMLILRGRS